MIYMYDIYIYVYIYKYIYIYIYICMYACMYVCTCKDSAETTPYKIERALVKPTEERLGTSPTAFQWIELRHLQK